MINKAVIALGSNINPRKNIETALKEIGQVFSVKKKSTFIFTEPVQYKDQADFLNGSVLIQTQLPRTALQKNLKQIETKLGRQRNGLKNGPRKIDLDLIVLNEEILDDDVFERDFLQRSVRELLPGMELNP